MEHRVTPPVILIIYIVLLLINVVFFEVAVVFIFVIDRNHLGWVIPVTCVIWLFTFLVSLFDHLNKKNIMFFRFILTRETISDYIHAWETLEENKKLQELEMKNQVEEAKQLVKNQYTLPVNRVTTEFLPLLVTNDITIDMVLKEDHCISRLLKLYYSKKWTCFIENHQLIKNLFFDENAMNIIQSKIDTIQNRLDNYKAVYAHSSKLFKPYEDEFLKFIAEIKHFNANYKGVRQHIIQTYFLGKETEAAEFYLL
jgi:hypothetical protein